MFPFCFCLNKLFLCFPTCCIICLVIKFLPGFALLKQSCFQTRARARVTLLLASSPCWSWTRFPGFPLDYTGSIPGKGTKIQLQDHLLLSCQDQENNFQTTWTTYSSIQTLAIRANAKETSKIAWSQKSQAKSFFRQFPENSTFQRNKSKAKNPIQFQWHSLCPLPHPKMHFSQLKLKQCNPRIRSKCQTSACI